MEQPQKKRGFWGAISLFGGRTPQATAESDDGASRAAQRTSAQAPESPAKRASDTQLQNRKILGRPQGPSSRLAQTLNASDFTKISDIPPNPTGTTPYKAASRMPGDNPYKTIGPGSSRPIAPAFPSRHSVYGSSTLPTNVFRESMKRPSIPSFAPKIPANTLKQSFPPNTPGKPPRGATAELNGRTMRQDDAVELFDMQIPNPPEDLSGEALSKQVPDDKARVGSIYADEFLAHYCPDDFDELQRRQFFCILDLRRLKYAADEIFVKKDWKLNVLNFAKEYEKSRSLIMLRYGLYEFKTIRASEAVTKEWKQKHGIADPEEESHAVVVSKPNNVGSKRKAEDDLALAKDTALTTSSTNMNKRARPESAAQTKVSDSNKNKRKASVGEPDENQPSKVQKAASPAKPPSLTRSIFESVANSPSVANKSAPKKSLLASATTKTPNGTTRSVFDSPAKPITHNIFGQLSDTSKGSGNEADSDSDAEEDAEDAEPESEQQSDEPSVVASGGIGTPQFGGLLPKTNGASSASSEAGESTKGRSLFDRVTRDAEGQPVRSHTPGNMFGAPTTPAPAVSFGASSAAPTFSFGATSKPQEPTDANNGAGSIFGQHLAPGGGTSTGTNSPFTFGGASSLATTPATGTPEPGTENEDAQKKPTDGDDEPQAQISLTDGGPGEEDESVVHEVRAKALKLVTKSDKDDDDEEDKKDDKNPWKVQGVGPLRVLKHKTTGAVRILLRAEPRGSVAMNKALLPNFTYKPEANGGKYVKITTSDDSGTGLETWMVQVKTPALAKALADVLEASKDASKK
ncbi:hypothetical protein GQ53DRAFT_645089 [Thozetella sp. PMI_491]|nr:hypothetical protein GQ53DRAFT_645089 [Thozetella sp. PMI_491]